MARVRRDKAASDRQLSELQRRVLEWLLEQALSARKRAVITNARGENAEAQSFPTERLKALNQKGVPWSAKFFYEELPTKAQTAALSRALHRLEVRGLVDLHDAAGGLGQRSRTTHVKLTKNGTDVAQALKKSEGKSERDLYEERRANLGGALGQLWEIRGQLKQKVRELQSLEDQEAFLDFFDVLLPKSPGEKSFREKWSLGQRDKELAALKKSVQELLDDHRRVKSFIKQQDQQKLN